MYPSQNRPSGPRSALGLKFIRRRPAVDADVDVNFREEPWDSSGPVHAMALAENGRTSACDGLGGARRLPRQSLPGGETRLQREHMHAFELIRSGIMHHVHRRAGAKIKLCPSRYAQEAKHAYTDIASTWGQFCCDIRCH